MTFSRGDPAMLGRVRTPILPWAALAALAGWVVLFDVCLAQEAHLNFARGNAKTENSQIVVPKIWDAKELATWALPVAGANVPPNFYSEEEYYAAPVDNLRTYPVYHPDREPKGYQNWLKQVEPQPLIEPQ